MEKGQEQPPPYDYGQQTAPPPQGYTHPQAAYPPQPQPAGYPQSGYPPQPQGYGPPITKPPGQQGYGQPTYPQGYGMQQQQQQSSAVIVTQPQGGMIVTGPRPTNWLIPAIFACLCFWPIGICAIIAANNANRAADTGDYAYAESKARSARSLVIASFVVGVICYVVIVVVRVVVYSSYYKY